MLTFFKTPITNYDPANLSPTFLTAFIPVLCINLYSALTDPGFGFFWFPVGLVIGMIIALLNLFVIGIPLLYLVSRLKPLSLLLTVFTAGVSALAPALLLVVLSDARLMDWKIVVQPFLVGASAGVIYWILYKIELLNSKIFFSVLGILILIIHLIWMGPKIK